MAVRIEGERTFALWDDFSWVLQKRRATDDVYYSVVVNKFNQGCDRWLSATLQGPCTIVLHQLQGEGGNVIK